MEQLPQPFNQEEIRRDPQAVVIGLLIGFLLIFSGVIATLYYRKEDTDETCDKKIEKLYAQMLDSRNKRIELYEEMIFYKKKSEDLEKQDSLLRSKTLPLINKIYENEK